MARLKIALIRDLIREGPRISPGISKEVGPMRDLALQHRLRYRKGEDGTYIIPGRRGFIYRHSDSRLGWCLTYDYTQGKQPTSRLKENAMKDPRLEVLLEGDEEAVFTFEPEDLPLIARKWCQARFRRRPRPSDLANLSRARKAPTGGVSGSQRGGSAAAPASEACVP